MATGPGAGRSGSLRDGEAVLGLPGGIRWVARHQADGYDPPHRFVDELTSRPLRAALRWRHVHEFAELGASRDRRDRHGRHHRTRGPAAAMFAYRQRQLTGDLAAHAWGRAFGADPLPVAITGGSGLIGTALTAFLTPGGHQVVRLVRAVPAGPDEREWHPTHPTRTAWRGSTPWSTWRARPSPAGSPGAQEAIRAQPDRSHRGPGCGGGPGRRGRPAAPGAW